MAATNRYLQNKAAQGGAGEHYTTAKWVWGRELRGEFKDA
jgi:hypothetical protein